MGSKGHMLFGFSDVCFGFVYFEPDIEKSASKEKYLNCPWLLTAYMEWCSDSAQQKANVGLTNADGKG